MKSNTRNIINKALKSNIKIKELNYDELHIFYDILKKTGDRKNFKVKSFNYYQNIVTEAKDTDRILELRAKAQEEDGNIIIHESNRWKSVKLSNERIAQIIK